MQNITWSETYAKFEPVGDSSTEGMAIASIAISLKRIADALTMCDKYGQTGSAAISSAIFDGIRESRPF